VRPHNLISYEWDPVFAERRNVDLETENLPYVVALAECGVERDTLVQTFMTSPDNSDLWLPEAAKVGEFCRGASLEGLETIEQHDPVALLDERGLKGGLLYSRKHRGPLTARDLYRALLRPVRAFTLANPTTRDF
jgi:hypothetical protein